MNIGFIGLGLMGRPMARHLANAGHQLHLWARRPATLSAFDDLPVCIHASPKEMASHAEVVFTMVADAPDVNEVLFGDQGVASGLANGSTIVDMSTISPTAARDIGERLLALGIRFLDAPVSGGETGAIAGNLTIMVGGDERIYAQVRPLFELMGKSVTHIGPTGSGQVAKACNQILTGVTVAAVAEAFSLADKSGVDPAKVRQALLGGSAYSTVLENHGLRMLEGDFKPGFKSWMHHKDLGIVMAEAHRLGLMLPNAAATAQLFNALIGHGHGEEDSVAIYKQLSPVSK